MYVYVYVLPCMCVYEYVCVYTYVSIYVCVLMCVSFTQYEVWLMLCSYVLLLITELCHRQHFRN